LNAHDPDAVAARVTADFRNEHTAALGQGTHGRAAYRARLPAFLAEFADLHYDVEDVVVEDDRAAVAYTMTCTFRATHPVTLRGMFLLRVRDGLVALRVDYWDGAEFTRQTADPAAPATGGAIPPMPGRPAR